MDGICVLDIGTTNIKLSIFTREGEILWQSKVKTPYALGNSSKVEIIPSKVLKAVLKMLYSNPKKNIPGRIRAIVIIGMASSMVPVNKNGEAVSNCICWNDRRNSEVCLEIDLTPIKNRLRQYPMPMYLPYRLKWYERNMPQVIANTTKWLNITNYIAFQLSDSGLFYTDYSQASRTFLFDIPNAKWDVQVAEFFGIDITRLPEPIPSASIIGKLRKEFISDPVYQDCMIVIGGHDHMCALLASGVNDSNAILNSTGTSEALVCPVPPNLSFPYVEAYCNLEYQVLENKFALVGYTTSTGKIFEWANERYRLFSHEKTMDIEKLTVNKRPIFVPPERHILPQFKGGFEGLESEFTEEDLSYSVLEGTVMESKVLLETMMHYTGIKPKLIRVVGGLARMRNYLKLKATVLGIPIEAIEDVDMATLGGYILGEIALGNNIGVSTILKEVWKWQKSERVEPDNSTQQYFGERFNEYKERRSAYDKDIDSR